MGPRAFTRRIGRNESFNHASNAFAAALAGVCAWLWGPIVVFYLIVSMALLSIVSVLTIRAEAIDTAPVAFTAGVPDRKKNLLVSARS